MVVLKSREKIAQIKHCVATLASFFAGYSNAAVSVLSSLSSSSVVHGCLNLAKVSTTLSLVLHSEWKALLLTLVTLY